MKPSEFSNPVEASVRNKALSLPEFPHAEVYLIFVSLGIYVLYKCNFHFE